MPISEESRTELLSREPGDAVLAAVEALLAVDSYLLTVNANERSISHRLAVHLNGRFDGYSVDCEYNRDDIDPKRIRYLNLDPREDDDEGQTVFPDIVVHKRGLRENYLVIEIKKSSSSIGSDVDIAKLEGYKADNRLRYEFALFLEFQVGDNVGLSQVRWVDVQPIG